MKNDVYDIRPDGTIEFHADHIDGLREMFEHVGLDIQSIKTEADYRAAREAAWDRYISEWRDRLQSGDKAAEEALRILIHEPFSNFIAFCRRQTFEVIADPKPASEQEAPLRGS